MSLNTCLTPIPIPEVPMHHRVLRETRALWELTRLARQWTDLTRVPQGAGETILVLPGFGTGDASTAFLRRYLTRLGYKPRGWGLGVNDGKVDELIPKVTALTRLTAEAVGAPIALVGWSLGGYLGREAAREHPASVSRIVTLGTPVIGGPKYTAAGKLYTKWGYDLDAIEAEVHERDRVPLLVPITAIYSRGDSVVSWQACIDHLTPHIRHVEVETTHVGFGFSPDVYREIAIGLGEGPVSPFGGECRASEFS